jgi:hypothetical protein
LALDGVMANAAVHLNLPPDITPEIAERAGLTCYCGRCSRERARRLLSPPGDAAERKG